MINFLRVFRVFQLLRPAWTTATRTQAVAFLPAFLMGKLFLNGTDHRPNKIVPVEFSSETLRPRQIMRSSGGFAFEFHERRDKRRRRRRPGTSPGCFSVWHFHTVCRRPVWKFDAAGTPSAYQYWVRTNTDGRMHYPSGTDKRGYKERDEDANARLSVRDLQRITVACRDSTWNEVSPLLFHALTWPPPPIQQKFFENKNLLIFRYIPGRLGHLNCKQEAIVSSLDANRRNDNFLLETFYREPIFRKKITFPQLSVNFSFSANRRYESIRGGS